MKKIYTLVLCSVLLLGTSISNATNVGGAYATNQHWTTAGSPYIVTSNIIILADLTVDAGVLVKFNSGLQIRIASTGTFNVNGTLADSVTFTSNNAIPARGDWNQIWLDQTTNTININYAKIKYANYGIYSWHSLANITHTRIEQCSNYGAYISNSGISNVDFCTIKHNTIGILLDQYGSITNSNVSNNDSSGISIYIYFGTVSNCTVTNNYYGILNNYPFGTPITNNIIQNNHFGIYGGGDITGNTIQNNTIGIYASRGPINCNNFNNNSAFNLSYQDFFVGEPIIDATGNYYNTTDSVTIDNTIYDVFDNASLSGYFVFSPYATSLIVAPSQPSAITGSASVCTGSTTNYSVTNVSGVSYTWTLSGGGSLTGTSNTASIDWYSVGTYTITVTPNIGCAQGNSSSLIVIVNETPTVMVNSPNLCSAGTATLTASGATTYSWTIGATSTGGGNATASPTVTTSYTVTGTTAGCSSTAIATVSINTVDTTVTNGGSYLASNNFGWVSFQWLDCNNGYAPIVGETNSYFYPTISGNYSVQITDNNYGCVDTSSCHHFCNSSVSVNSPTICSGETAILTASGATTYSWTAGATSTGVNTATVSPTSTNSYTVTGTALGCTSSAVAYVTVNTIDTSVYASGTYFYAYENGTITYQWLDCNNGNTPISGATNQTFFPAATGAYSVEVTNYITGCIGTSNCHSFIFIANDTCHFSVYDTTHILSYDTTHISVYDTTHFSVYDTIHITSYDTTHIAVTDTLIINALLTGIIPPNNTNTIKIFPNPTSDHIYINTGTNVFMTGYTIEIRNTLAQLVYSQVMTASTQYFVDLSGWTGTGTYFVSIKDLSSTVIATKTIILQ
jgi:hypothetical protein